MFQATTLLYFLKQRTTLNNPQRSKTIRNNPENVHNNPQRPITTRNDPGSSRKLIKMPHNDPQRPKRFSNNPKLFKKWSITIHNGLQNLTATHYMQERSKNNQQRFTKTQERIENDLHLTTKKIRNDQRKIKNSFPVLFFHGG